MATTASCKEASVKMKMKTKTLGTVLVIGVMVLAECIGGQRKGQTGQGSSGRPNIILVLTDDLDRNLGTLEHLSKLKEMLAGEGLTFPNMFVSESLCCPLTVVHPAFPVRAQPPGAGQFAAQRWIREVPCAARG
jgi:hypothetical protein